MKAIYKLPGKDPEVIEAGNDLATLQKLVGGYIETVTIASDTCIICNEEGRLLELQNNIIAFGRTIVGPILIVGVDGDQFCDVPYPEFWMNEIKGGK